jgi:hypothetical protein
METRYDELLLIVQVKKRERNSKQLYKIYIFINFIYMDMKQEW